MIDRNETHFSPCLSFNFRTSEYEMHLVRFDVILGTINCQKRTFSSFLQRTHFQNFVYSKLAWVVAMIISIQFKTTKPYCDICVFILVSNWTWLAFTGFQLVFNWFSTGSQLVFNWFSTCFQLVLYNLIVTKQMSSFPFKSLPRLVAMSTVFLFHEWWNSVIATKRISSNPTVEKLNFKI